MKIDKAIELLTTAKAGWPATNAEKYYKALELGIEALVFFKRLEDTGALPNNARLPGETKD